MRLKCTYCDSKKRHLYAVGTTGSVRYTLRTTCDAWDTGKDEIWFERHFSLCNLAPRFLRSMSRTVSDWWSTTVITICGTANAATVLHVGCVASGGHCLRFYFREADFHVACVYTLKTDGLVSCSLDLRCFSNSGFTQMG